MPLYEWLSIQVGIPTAFVHLILNVLAYHTVHVCRDQKSLGFLASKYHPETSLIFNM